ncbi:MAG: S8 family serine peptidase [Acidimicrobiia bacterium]|nr:S8 family serine peptidase [Acidimicrobiia bacterium]
MTTLLSTPSVRAEPDPLRAEQWGLDRIRAGEVWEEARGEGRIVAVVDSGVDGGHPDLQDRLVAGRDFVGDGAGTTDLLGHGTHVAGIVAATSGNGIGGSGCAPGAKVMPVRVLDAQGTGTADRIADGVRWAVDRGADVVNLSLGEEGIAGRLTKGGPLNAAIRYAAARGVVVVAAAGNGNEAGRGTPRRDYRTGVPVLVVTAVDEAGNPTVFTNYGDLRAVAAPGTAILSTIPTYPTVLFPDPGDGFAPLDGTSMATPFVACEAALLLELGVPAAEIPGLIQETAAEVPDPRAGAGIVDMATAVAAAVAAGESAQEAGHGDDGAAGIPPAVLVLGSIAAGLALGFVIGAIMRARRRGT